MTIVSVFTSQDDNFNDDFRYRGTYLHGKMESDYQYDIFSFSEAHNFGEGIHEVMVSDRECFFMLWKREQFEPYGGFLIYKDDPDVSHCLEHYIRHSSNI